MATRKVRVNRRKTRKYRQRGGALKEDAIAILKTNDHSLISPANKENFFFRGPFTKENGNTFKLGEYTFTKGLVGRGNYKIFVQKDGSNEKVEIAYFDDY
jgi:hypothetical protein